MILLIFYSLVTFLILLLIEIFMKLQYAVAALALSSAFAMPVAYADTAPIQSVPLSIDSATGDLTSYFGGTHSGTSAFNDVFNFTPTLSSGLATTLVSSFTLFGGGVTFNSASLNGVSLMATTPLSPASGFTIYNLVLGAQQFTGPLQLLVSGNSFGSISSYNGSISVTAGTPIPSPVPEPETYAMMLAGLGLLGFAARRKAKSNQA
ncbi:FxDxF family PEP-CTERM protein [Actimicrobium sp. CCI2.3]|uniref:FxDxF family PEP-CTERM protein n=1 Tax=Actimicrobium sp. CCI2.3 TaxID=3048616 RepID=UPI002AB40A05|nr:FxDxF family PEP-CTERM protein [Actimicrobium sp. CCI2.3]MDY7575670.1 FxDxF family PEP-CTERM protein [Actimicrobium sp. CCI2.3]MEB0021959.1 FxDxF family PEP-CTERM protein [Actimicrobium sp. CCI2.3]